MQLCVVGFCPPKHSCRKLCELLPERANILQFFTLLYYLDYVLFPPLSIIALPFES